MIDIRHGDCLDVLPTLESVDSVVTDPPYGLEFMGKEWDRLDGGFSKPGIGERQTDWPSFGGDPFAGYNPTCETCGGRARGKRKCLCAKPAWKVKGKATQGAAGPSMQDWHRRWAVAVLRVLKPGAYLLAFGGTRTFHRLACALEDAGFEIRDTLCWLYGSGFPKAKSCLKPAWEPIILCRKPGRGVRALNVDACRVSCEGGSPSIARRESSARTGKHPGNPGMKDGTIKPVITNRVTFETYTAPHDGEALGRWPANVIHDGSDEVMEAFAAFGERAVGNPNCIGGGSGGVWSDGDGKPCGPSYADTGTAARFFYCAKASRSERGDGNTHPTVKPLALIRWLVRLITPPGGTCLDPFLGSGTTALACEAEGRNCIGIEREAEYVEIAKARVASATAGMFAEAAV